MKKLLVILKKKQNKGHDRINKFYISNESYK
jgi:hypothetical protein